MRVAYITDEILNEAYERNDLSWMLMMWERKGLAGTYPSPEMHTFAFSQMLKAMDSIPHQYYGNKANRHTFVRNWQNICKFLDTIITHPEYRLNVVAPHRKIIEELSLKHVPVEVQLEEVN